MVERLKVYSMFARLAARAALAAIVAAAGWRLDDRDMAEIDRITAG